MTPTDNYISDKEKDTQFSEIANEIVNYFMGRGATVSKKDYDYALSSLTKVREEAIKETMEIFYKAGYCQGHFDGSMNAEYNDEMPSEQMKSNIEKG